MKRVEPFHTARRVRDEPVATAREIIDEVNAVFFSHWECADCSRPALNPAEPPRYCSTPHRAAPGRRACRPGCTSRLRCPDRLPCGGGRRVPTNPPRLRPAVLIPVLFSNRPWHPTKVPRGRAQGWLAARSP